MQPSRVMVKHTSLNFRYNHFPYFPRISISLCWLPIKISDILSRVVLLSQTLLPSQMFFIPILKGQGVSSTYELSRLREHYKQILCYPYGIAALNFNGIFQPYCGNERQFATYWWQHFFWPFQAHGGYKVSYIALCMLLTLISQEF